MSRKKPWDGRWELARELGEGGQGVTYVVRGRGSDVEAVLKVQRHGKASKDAERRGRFRREAVALQTLDHRRIPKLLDDNTAEFRDPQVDLFIVQELIPGSNLADLLAKTGPLGTTAAIDMIRALLEVVAYCHEQGVGHRDIKPDNILLRGDEPADPVLVDFGQSFPSVAADASMVTYDGQIMGNRFLALPEQTSGPMKRDLPSDLAQLAGVLFFCVTGIIPRQLRDRDDQPPHRRPDAALLFATLDRADTLGWFFDRAFRHRTVERFQEPGEFGKALDYLASGAGPRLSAILAAGKDRLARSADIRARELFPQLRDSLVDLAKKAGKVVHREMAGIGVHTLPGDIDKSTFRTNWKVDFGIGVNERPQICAVLGVWVFYEDDLFKIHVSPPEGGPARARFETSVFEPVIPPDFGERLARALAIEFAGAMERADLGGGLTGPVRGPARRLVEEE